MNVLDYVKTFLEKHGIPLTRDSYIRLNWPGRDLNKEPLLAEELTELPEEIQIQSEGGWVN